MKTPDLIVCDHAPIGRRAGTVRPLGADELPGMEFVPNPRDDYDLPDIVDDEPG